MVERVEHVIRGLRPGRLPQALAVVGYQLETEDWPGAPGSKRVHLPEAYLTVLRRRGTGPRSAAGYQCHGAAELLEHLAALCRPRCKPVVLTSGALSLWSAAGLWERCTAGEWLLTAPRRGRPAAAPGKGRPPWRGFVCLEDPPFVCELQHAQTGGRLILLDTANFAWTCPEQVQGAAERARETLAWLDEWLLTLERLRLGSWCQTLAAQAYRGYLTSYYRSPITVHSEPELLRLERLAYFGGRCECSFIGRAVNLLDDSPRAGFHGYAVPQRWCPGGIYRLDVNSAYSHVAALDTVPASRAHWYRNGCETGTLRGMRGLRLLAAVTVSTTLPVVPWSAWRDRELTRVLQSAPPGPPPRPGEDDVYFPVGTFRTVLAGPELELLLESGDVLACHAVALYDRADLFSSFSSALWKERRAAKAEGRTRTLAALKLLPCVLIGRFAQQSRRWQDTAAEPTVAPWCQWDALDPESGLPVRWRALSWRVQRQEPAGETAESCPAIAAWVTSLARVYLWHLMQEAGRSDVLYCDTDSLWVTRDGLDRLTAAGRIAPDQLGGLKEEAHYLWAEFIGPKHYATAEGLTCAGLPAAATTTDGRHWRWLRAEGFAGALPDGRPPAGRLDPASRRAPYGYHYGTVLQDGTVIPLRLGGAV